MTAGASAAKGGDAKAAAVGTMVAWTFGMTLPVMFIVTWTDEFSPLQQITRAYALPMVAVEFAIIAVSFVGGFRLGKPQWLPLALLGLLLFHAWTGAIGSELQTPSLLRTGIWTIQVIFAVAIVNLWRQGMLELVQMRVAILAGFALFLALIVTFVATTVQQPEDRISNLPAFVNVRWFAYYGAAAVGLAAPGFLRGNKGAQLVAAIAFASFFWTGSRGGLFAAVGGMVGCAILFTAFRDWRVWMRLLLCGAAGFVLSIPLGALVPFEAGGIESIARSGDSQRIQIWKDTIGAIGQHPWLGWGEGQFREIFRHQWPFAQPHNVVLQVLLAWGVLGAALCLALATWIAPRFVRSMSDEAAPFQCAALMLAAYSLIDGSLYYTHSLALFTLCCSAAVAAGMPRDVDAKL